MCTTNNNSTDGLIHLTANYYYRYIFFFNIDIDKRERDEGGKVCKNGLSPIQCHLISNKQKKKKKKRIAY